MEFQEVAYSTAYKLSIIYAKLNSEVLLLLFTGPGYAYDYRETISAGERLQVLARNSPTGDWLLVTTSQGKSGWVRSTLVKVNIPLSAVPVITQLPPTPTLRPSITPTPGIRLPYKDDFSNPASGWSVGSGTSCARSYEKGEYHIVAKVESIICWVSRVGDDPQGFSDFSLQVTARRVEGANGEYGLIFRERVGNDDKKNAYFFRIDPAGYYALHKLVQSEWITLIPWTASSHIKTGSAPNILKVTARGTRITIFVNGQQLGSITDATFSQGKIGMCAGSAKGETNFRVAFDDFEVTSVP